MYVSTAISVTFPKDKKEIAVEEYEVTRKVKLQEQTKEEKERVYYKEMRYGTFERGHCTSNTEGLRSQI